MRVLFDHDTPFLLAHGGFQTQITLTRQGLENAGVTVDWLRWWDDSQTGDLIHYFGRPAPAYIEFAHQKGMKVVAGELLTGLASRSAVSRRLQKLLMRAAQAILPRAFLTRLAWETYQKADLFVALTPWEASLMIEMFGASPLKVHCVPNGVEDVFLSAPPEKRGMWLVCTATLAVRKRVVELAQAAIKAQTPLWVVGVPYSTEDPYARRFLDLVRDNPKWLRYEGGIRDRKALSQCYRQARGFVLLSDRESLSLSALEAAACECPMLLSDLPWARTFFGASASYCPVTTPRATAPFLRSFYDRAPELPAPPRPKSWDEIGRALRDAYKTVMGQVG